MTSNIEMPSQVSSWAVVRRFLAILFPLLILIGGIATALYYVDTKINRSIFEINEVRNVDLQREIIANDFRSIVSDLMILSEGNELQVMLESEAAGPRQALAKEFLSFSQRKGLYDQIRFLDETGMEVVRVNFNDGEPAIVPEEQLQFKGERYYFRDIFELGRGEVFVSPLDLNIEHGEIEQPLKPMIRFGTPVFDRQGRKRGIVLLNYFGAELIGDLERTHAHAQGQVMLLNATGFWLHGPQPEDEWGFMYADRSERAFGNAFPEAWQRISGAESGQFVNADGMFTFATVYPLLEAQTAAQGMRIRSSIGSGEAFEPSAGRVEAKAYYWKIVSHVPLDVLDAGSRSFLGSLLLLSAALAIPLAMGSWYLARAGVSRQQAQAALHGSEARLRAQYKGIPVPTYTWQKVGEDMVLVDYNDAAVEITHGKIADIMGIELSEMYEDTSEIHKDISRCFAEKTSIKREMLYRFRTMDEKRYLAVKYAFVPPDLVLVHTENITERVRAEEELRTSKRFVDKIISASPNFIYVIDIVNQKYLFVNDAYEKVLGYPTERILADEGFSYILSKIHPDDRAPLIERQNSIIERFNRQPQLLKQDEVHEFEYRVKDANDNWRWIRSWGVVFETTQENTVSKILGVAYDVTERVQAEEEIRRRNRELALLNSVIAAATSTLNVEQMLRTTCQELAQAFDLPQAAAALLNEEGTEATAVAEYLTPGRPSSLGKTIPVTGNPATEYVLENKIPLAVADAQTDERMAAVHDIMRTRGTVSLLILPLMERGQVIGTIGLDAIERREFSDEEITLAQNVVAAAGQALETARLHQALRRHAGELEERVRERTAELRKFVNLMAGREVRMAELKDVIRELRAQLRAAGLTPVADDPLLGEGS